MAGEPSPQLPGRSSRDLAPGAGGLGVGPVPGQVGRCAQWLFLVDEGLAQLGVRLARAGEIAAHDGEFGGTVGGQRPLSLR
jgi:hypothetical protein